MHSLLGPRHIPILAIRRQTDTLHIHTPAISLHPLCPLCLSECQIYLDLLVVVAVADP